MRVLLVSQIYGRDYGRNYFLMPQKMLHGFVRDGHAVQAFSDRDTARASNPFGTQKLGRRAVNRRILEVCRNFRPHLVFLMNSELIANATLDEMRTIHPEVGIVYVNVDPVHDANNRRRIFGRRDAVDAIMLSAAGPELRAFAGGRARVHYAPNPVDVSVESLRQFEQPAAALPTELFFGISGIISDRPDVRVEIVRRLQDALPDLAFEARGVDRPAVRGAAYFDRLAQARMGLNFSRISDHYLYSSNRMSQYVGCGLLTFIDRATGFGDLFADDELAFYESFEDLVEQIGFYRARDDARRRVAEKGWRRATGMFDVARVARYVAEATLGRPYSLDYEWPTGAAEPAAAAPAAS